jgi:hypothetical protein
MISIKAACPERPGMAPGRTERKIFLPRAKPPEFSGRVSRTGPESESCEDRASRRKTNFYA